MSRGDIESWQSRTPAYTACQMLAGKFARQQCCYVLAKQHKVVTTTASQQELIACSGNAAQVLLLGTVQANATLQWLYNPSGKSTYGWSPRLRLILSLTCVHAAERSERARLEKENAKLLAKAFEAPSTALLEVRTLTSELYTLRCEKANAELREAEARREVAAQINRVCFLALHNFNALLHSNEYVV